jgi:hypothetical protein
LGRPWSGKNNVAEVIDIQSDRDSAQRAPERQIERDAMAQAAWTKGYLYGIGKPNIARALARNVTLENIRYRRAAQAVTRALDRNRTRILKDIGAG